MSTKFFAQNIHFLVNNKVLETLVPLPLTRLTALMSMFLSFCIQKYKVFGNLPVFLIRRRPTTFFFLIITTTNLSIWFVASFFWYKSLLFLRCPDSFVFMETHYKWFDFKFFFSHNKTSKNSPRWWRKVFLSLYEIHIAKVSPIKVLQVTLNLKEYFTYFFVQEGKDVTEKMAGPWKEMTLPIIVLLWTCPDF